MTTHETGDAPRRFGIIVLVVGVVLILTGYLGLYYGIPEFSSIGAGILSMGVGILVIRVAVTNPERLAAVSKSYLSTAEGATSAIIVAWFSFFSFAIIIDRTPTRLAAPPGSPEGLFVVPREEFFPLGIDLSVLFYISVASIMIVVLGIVFSNIMTNFYIENRLPERWPFEEWHYIWCKVVTLLFLLFVVILFVLLDLSIPGGFEIEGRTPSSIPFTGMFVILVVWVLLLLPVSVYTLPLLPEWVSADNSNKAMRSESLEYYIDANWRRARVLITLILTGAIGTTLPFVFSRTSPYLLFVVAIVGSITLGPLGVVWFLMRRIREAEKELHPT